jgi:hypothetical protein
VQARSLDPLATIVRIATFVVAERMIGVGLSEHLFASATSRP